MGIFSWRQYSGACKLQVVMTRFNYSRYRLPKKQKKDGLRLALTKKHSFYSISVFIFCEYYANEASCF